MIPAARWSPIFFPAEPTHGISGRKESPAYDFCPFRLTEKEMLRIHGNNERISLENLKFGIRLMTEVIKEIST